MKDIAPDQVGIMKDVAKVRAFDKLFFETSIEEEDINKSFYVHRIYERTEFKQIIYESKVLYQK